MTGRDVARPASSRWGLRLRSAFFRSHHAHQLGGDGGLVTASCCRSRSSPRLTRSDRSAGSADDDGCRIRRRLDVWLRRRMRPHAHGGRSSPAHLYRHRQTRRSVSGVEQSIDDLLHGVRRSAPGSRSIATSSPCCTGSACAAARRQHFDQDRALPRRRAVRRRSSADPGRSGRRQPQHHGQDELWHGSCCAPPLPLADRVLFIKRRTSDDGRRKRRMLRREPSRSPWCRHHPALSRSSLAIDAPVTFLGFIRNKHLDISSHDETMTDGQPARPPRCASFRLSPRRILSNHLSGLQTRGPSVIERSMLS